MNFLNYTNKPENNQGNVEYKFKLIEKNNDRINNLVTQMRYRVDEGNGEAIYVIGIMDDGEMVGITKEEYTKTIMTLKSCADKNNYVVKLLSKTEKNNKFVYEILIRENNISNYIDIKVAVAGNVDSGKSSTIGTLISDRLDDGRGLNRLKVFNHQHEVNSGRTSSVSQSILGFDIDGNIVNYNDFSKKMSWEDIVKTSKKIVSFFDLCGHKKYFKTTIRGLTSTLPDVCLVMVGGNMGLSRMTREHIFLCITMNIPFCIVVTKMDLCETRKNVLKETTEKINKLLKLPGIRRIPYNVNKFDDVLVASKNIHSESIVPIFKISNVTGIGLDQLKHFLNLLQKKQNKSKDDNVEFYIDTIFNVKGVGIVVGGNITSGTIKTGDKLLLGPIMGKYKPITIKSIHDKKMLVDKISCDKYACFSIKKIQRNELRKGQVIINGPPVSVTEFDAEILILKSNHTTIRVGYEPVLHTGSIRQIAKIINISNKINYRKTNVNDDNILRTGDKANVRFKFKFRPEFIKPNTKILFTEGNIKVVGVVKNIFQ